MGVKEKQIREKSHATGKVKKGVPGNIHGPSPGQEGLSERTKLFQLTHKHEDGHDHSVAGSTIPGANEKKGASCIHKPAGGRKTVLQADGLTIVRGGVAVVRDATFSVYAGDYVGIVGPNGGGKTTLVRAMLGLLPPSSGTIKLFDSKISSFKNWERVAYVSQDAISFDDDFPLTVRELVSLGRLTGLRLGRRFKKDDWKAVDEALELMGLSDLADRRIGNLSGGQKQRCFVAKALVRNPEVLFLDEPVSGVDAQTQEMFFKMLSNLNRIRNLTILIVSHDLTAVFCRMSKVICVNREVHTSDITDDTDPTEIVKQSYGDHFHFTFHQHECRGDF